MKDSSLSAKKHDKKVYITDIAIEKIPKIEYKGLSQKENEALFRLARMVLMTSKLENDSNEVAITCTLDSDDPMDVIGVSLGEEHSVNICANTVANHLIVSSRMCAVVIMHNHPSTQTLSLEDIHFLLSYSSVRFMIVVTNQGNVHYLCKDSAYSYEAARELYNDSINNLDKKSSKKEIYLAGLSFLARCSEVGLFYS